jgi:hypothetical protein
MPTAITNSTIPMPYTIQVLQQALTARNQGNDWLIECDHGNQLIVLGSSNRFFAPSDVIQPGSGKECDVRSLTSTQRDALLTIHNDKSGRPLDELIWCMAFHLSDGELLSGCRRDDVVKLTRWPNLTRLPNTPNGFRIAALLTQRATSPVLASRLLKISEAEINRFYSAAQRAGYTTIINRQPSTVIERKEHRHQSIIGKLFAHLSGKSKAK